MAAVKGRFSVDRGLTPGVSYDVINFEVANGYRCVWGGGNKILRTEPEVVIRLRTENPVGATFEIDAGDVDSLVVKLLAAKARVQGEEDGTEIS